MNHLVDGSLDSARLLSRLMNGGKILCSEPRKAKIEANPLIDICERMHKEYLILPSLNFVQVLPDNVV